MKICMEIGVEGRRPVGGQKNKWLEKVEADKAEHRDRQRRYT